MNLSPRLQALRAASGRLPVSVIITTLNEEVNIRECLESVAWADEILLVDSFSTDRTLAIAREFKSPVPFTILEREYFGSAAQKNWSMDRVQHDWVLIIDADERVPEDLAAEILGLLIKHPPVNGYFIRRENVFIDKIIRHSGWSTDKVVRLFRRDRGRYPNRRVHADLEIEGAVPTMKHALLHYTFRSFDQYFRKFINYAEWGAAQAYRDGKNAGFLEVAIRPLWRFIRMYVLQLGFLDGMHGLVVCGLQAFGTVLKYARVWEYRIRAARGEDIVLPAFDEEASTWQKPGDREM
jgi:glycosyltransferase involved in cell wall biosynthesis